MISPRKLLPRNIATNWIALLVNGVIAFIMNPFLIHRLGTDLYGLWILVFSIMSYADFLDAGVRQSLAKYLPKYYALNDDQKLNEVMNSSNAVYLVAGSLTIVGTLLVTAFGVQLLNISPEELSIFKWTMLIVGANTAAIFIFMPSTAIGPFHRYDIRNGIQISSNIAGALVIAFFVYQGIGLIELALIILFMTLGRLGVSRWYQQRLVPSLRFNLRFIKRDMIRELLGYGSYSFLIVIASLVIFNTDNIIIGIYLSTTYVTYFSVAATIMQYLRSIVQAAGLPLTPAISHFEATSDLQGIVTISRKILLYVQYMATATCLDILLFGGDFISLWVGPGFNESAEFLMILIVPAILFLPLTTSNAVLFGLGKHRLLFHILAGEACANIALSLILVRFYGAYGVALGTAIPQIVIYSTIYPIAYHRAIGTGVKRYYLDLFKAVGLAVVFCVPVGLLLKHLMTIDSWFSFVVVIGMTSVVFGIGFVWLILQPEDMKRVKRFIRKDEGVSLS